MVLLPVPPTPPGAEVKSEPKVESLGPNGVASPSISMAHDSNLK